MKTATDTQGVLFATRTGLSGRVQYLARRDDPATSKAATWTAGGVK